MNSLFDSFIKVNATHSAISIVKFTNQIMLVFEERFSIDSTKITVVHFRKMSVSELDENEKIRDSSKQAAPHSSFIDLDENKQFVKGKIVIRQFTHSSNQHVSLAQLLTDNVGTLTRCDWTSTYQIMRTEAAQLQAYIADQANTPPPYRSFNFGTFECGDRNTSKKAENSNTWAAHILDHLKISIPQEKDPQFINFDTDNTARPITASSGGPRFTVTRQTNDKSASYSNDLQINLLQAIKTKNLVALSSIIHLSTENINHVFKNGYMQTGVQACNALSLFKFYEKGKPSEDDTILYNLSGFSILMLATYLEQVEVVHFLLKNSVANRYTLANGYSAMDIAIALKNITLVKLFFEYDAYHRLPFHCLTNNSLIDLYAIVGQQRATYLDKLKTNLFSQNNEPKEHAPNTDNIARLTN